MRKRTLVYTTIRNQEGRKTYTIRGDGFEIRTQTKLNQNLDLLTLLTYPSLERLHELEAWERWWRTTCDINLQR